MFISPAIETAQAFWATLLPHALTGGALAHTHSTDDDQDDDMGEGGWKMEYVQWWFDFLAEKGGKGISKDTWVMVSCVYWPMGLGISASQCTLLTTCSSPNLCARSTQDLRNTTWKVSSTRRGQLWHTDGSRNVAAWPSTIDDFVDWAKERIHSEAA